MGKLQFMHEETAMVEIEIMLKMNSIYNLMPVVLVTIYWTFYHLIVSYFLLPLLLVRN